MPIALETFNNEYEEMSLVEKGNPVTLTLSCCVQTCFLIISFFNIESFFIYTGFALYFGLHVLASNTVSLNFRYYWFFAQYATLISLIYWIGSVFFIWKIKSKHLF